MKRRDALKGLSLLGFLSVGGNAPVAEAAAPVSPQMPNGLRQIWEGMQFVGRVKALQPGDQRRLIADLRAKNEHRAADWVARVCSIRA